MKNILSLNTDITWSKPTTTVKNIFLFFHRYLRILSHMDMVDWKELQHGFIFGGNPKIFK